MHEQPLSSVKDLGKSGKDITPIFYENFVVL